ncbi:DUF3040 domain-containing protein [Williamsia herbipolensis]|uniref:DUF3040 domain-containing protein n=1 Tax=Williamsia herbipolensis TaxID=1603258 RepID=A0AAU4K4T2_9NOCA|nr:DUF3040 domain-containing protein [Williamsia herbipolensis]
MPLSEHEQRMLEQIENALYAEDPKFASNVRRRRVRGGSTTRKRLQAAVLFVVGLLLLIGGLVVDVTVGGFPILSLVGFLVMFAAGLIALWGIGSSVPPASGATSESSTGRRPRGNGSRSFSERMEERFNRRFEQE